MRSFWAGLEVVCSVVLMFHRKGSVTWTHLISWTLTTEMGKNSISYSSTTWCPFVSKYSIPPTPIPCLTSRSWNKQDGAFHKRRGWSGGGADTEVWEKGRISKGKKSYRSRRLISLSVIQVSKQTRLYGMEEGVSHKRTAVTLSASRWNKSMIQERHSSRGGRRGSTFMQKTWKHPHRHSTP